MCGHGARFLWNSGRSTFNAPSKPSEAVQKEVNRAMSRLNRCTSSAQSPTCGGKRHKGFPCPPALRRPCAPVKGALVKLERAREAEVDVRARREVPLELRKINLQRATFNAPLKSPEQKTLESQPSKKRRPMQSAHLLASAVQSMPVLMPTTRQSRVRNLQKVRDNIR